MTTRRRVAVTGIGMLSPLGDGLDAAMVALEAGRSGVTAQPEWSVIRDLRCRVGAAVPVALESLPRTTRRLGRLGVLAYLATEQALAQSGLPRELLGSGEVGLCYGSTHGSTTELESFCRKLFEQSSLASIPGSSYLKFMSHTCAATLAQIYGIRGRVVPVISACTSASQSIGHAYETVRSGAQIAMLAGGAEELHPIHAGVFDLVFAASTGYNDTPDLTPRPFDRARDGLVIGEGAGTLVLEDWEHARARGATILAELQGYGTCCDGTHITAPNSDGMASAMRLALRDAGLAPADIGYINAHATATEAGDIAESTATHDVFGPAIAISSTKGYTGHTLGACGAIELGFAMGMLQRGVLIPNRNLKDVDERCAPLDYLREPRPHSLRRIMSNNFAFGGINTSLIVGLPE